MQDMRARRARRGQRTAQPNGFKGQIKFWENRLELSAQNPSDAGGYSVERCHGAIKHYKGRHEEWVAEKRKMLGLTDDTFTAEQLLQFYRYEAVRKGGDFNMITEAEEAAERASLYMEDYGFVQDNYIDLQKLAKNTHT